MQRCFPEAVGEILQSGTGLRFLGALGVETQLPQMRLKLLLGLEGFVGRRLDRDFDQIVAAGKSPLLKRNFMRKSLVSRASCD